MSDYFVTVFFDDESEMPQDFPTYTEAEMYAEDRIRGLEKKGYTIESPC